VTRIPRGGRRSKRASGATSTPSDAPLRGVRCAVETSTIGRSRPAGNSESFLRPCWGRRSGSPRGIGRAYPKVRSSTTEKVIQRSGLVRLNQFARASSGTCWNAPRREVHELRTLRTKGHRGGRRDHNEPVATRGRTGHAMQTPSHVRWNARGAGIHRVRARFRHVAGTVS
jgi:hypothetical protein